jgi:RNA recognition motif-containing protein
MHPETQTKTISSRKNFKVFLGGTPFNCTTREVREYFTKYGEIKKVYFPIDKRKKRQKGFAFVTFKTESTYKQVLKDREHTIRGRTVIARDAMNQTDARENDKKLHEKKLYVHGFPIKETTEQEIFNLFSQHGKVDRVLMGYKSDGQIAFRGFAYIVMEEKRDCQKLLNKKSIIFKENTISIQKCRTMNKEVPSANQKVSPGSS